MEKVIILSFQILVYSYIAISFIGHLVFHYLLKKTYEANSVLMRDNILNSSLYKRLTSENLFEIMISSNVIVSTISTLTNLVSNLFYWTLSFPLFFIDLIESAKLMKKLFATWNSEEYTYLFSKVKWTYSFHKTGDTYPNESYHSFKNSYGLEVKILKDYLHKKDYVYFTLFGKTKPKTEVKFLVTDYLFEKNNIQIFTPLMEILLADYFYKFLEESDDLKLQEYFSKHDFNETDYKQRYPKFVLWLYDVWGQKIKDKPIFFVQLTNNSCLNQIEKIVNDDKKRQYLKEAL